MYNIIELYNTSKDYRLLYQLLSDNFRVVCFIENPKQLIALFKPSAKYYPYWRLSVPGQCYLEFDYNNLTVEDFIEECDSLKLQFIESNK